MKLACITDPQTHPAFDTTVELYRRFALDSRISLTHIAQKSVLAGALHGIEIDAPLSYEKFLSLNSITLHPIDLKSFDLIFCRSDKPLPDLYYDNLARYEREVQFVNRPSALREVSKRFFIQSFAGQFLPDYIETDSPEYAVEFLKRFERIVFKSADSYGGKEIWRAELRDGGAFVEHASGETRRFESSFDACAWVLKKTTSPMQLVRYLKNVGAGDKRVLVVGEKILGGYLRRAQNGSWINNITAGGSAELSSVSEHEKMVIEATVGEFTRRGVHTLGYDFLMDDNRSWILSEVNAGNIGGYNRLEELSGTPIIGELIEWLIRFSQH